MPKRRALALLLVAVCVALVLRAPAVKSPFFADDLVQMTYLESGDPGSYSFRHELDLFRFLDGDVAAARVKMARGDLPWRFDTSQKLAFFRPVSSAAMWVDSAIFGQASIPAHVHSLLWFVAFCGALFLLYTRILPAGAAAVALLFAAISPATIMTVVWWCDRYALLAAVFAAVSLAFHERWLAHRRTADLGLSLASLALALGSAESGTQTLAFVLACTLVRSGGSLVRTARLLLPASVVLVAYVVAVVGLGYGVERSALYVHPLAEPGEYLSLLVTRFHRGLSMAFFADERSLLLGGGVVLASLPLLRWVIRSDAQVRGTLAWLALGSLLALLPCFSGRNAFRPWTFAIPQIGIHAMLGLLVVAPWRQGAALRTAPVAALCSLALGVVFAVLPLDDHWRAARANRDTPAVLARQISPALRTAITPETRRLVILRAPVVVMPVGRLAMWHGVNVDAPANTTVVSDSGWFPGELLLTRTGASEFTVDARGLANGAALVRRDDVFRFGARAPFAVGDEVRLDGFAVTIREVRDGSPVVAGFEFDQPLDDPGLVFATWVDGAYVPVVIPAVGDSIRL